MTTERERPLELGDKVHYVSYGTPGGEFAQRCRLAFVTEVSSQGGTDGITPPRAFLTVLNPTGLFFHPNPLPHVPEPGHGGTFHFPGECWESPDA